MNQIRGRTNQQSLDEVAEVTGGAVHVTNTGIAGTNASYVMFSSTTFADNDVLGSTTGFKQLTFTCPAAAAATAAVVGFSTTANDTAALGTVLAAATNNTTGWGKSAKEATITPLTNVRFLTNGNPITVTWDGTTTFKTICVLSDHNTASQIIVDTVA